MKLDSVALQLSKKWGFAPTEELPGGHCSRVYADQSKVLKVPFQGEEMTSGFWATLRLPSGPRVFESDPTTGAILMERAIPGTKLHESGLDEDDQTAVWRDIALAIRTISGDDLLPMNRYYGASDPLVVELIETTDQNTPLHGDLHHENILRHGDGWMCIDAKGLIGDPANEGAAFVCNPIADLAERSVEGYLNRIEKVAKALDVDPFRVWAWSLARMREEIPSPDEPWYAALVALNACAKAFDAEQWVMPLA